MPPIGNNLHYFKLVALPPSSNLPIYTLLPAPCVEAIKEASLSERDFHIYRATYNDPAKWSEFQTRFNALIEDQLTPASGGGIDTVRDSLLMEWVDDSERLNNAGVPSVSQ
jgi:hypothetical protein